jgi:putative transposase
VEGCYGVAEDDLTPSRGWSLARLRKTWSQRTNAVAPWWATNSKEADNSGLDGLARALQKWSTSRSGRRAGAALGFAKFTATRCWARSVRFTTGAIHPGGGRWPPRHTAAAG